MSEKEPTMNKDTPDRPDIPVEVNVIIENREVPDFKGQVIGTAVKTLTEEEYLETEIKKEKVDKKKKKTGDRVTFKSYSLKETKEEWWFRCRVCKKIMNSIWDYNKHYLDEHPPSHWSYCTCSFISPRTLVRDMYSHKEIMFNCKICEKGFSFDSQYKTHNCKHSMDTGFVYMKAGWGKRFKCDNELKKHVASHHKTAIKCGAEGCKYSNCNIRNVIAHRKCHSDILPYSCNLCGTRFRWQQQKKRHTKVCSELN